MKFRSACFEDVTEILSAWDGRVPSRPALSGGTFSSASAACGLELLKSCRSTERPRVAGDHEEGSPRGVVQTSISEPGGRPRGPRRDGGPPRGTAGPFSGGLEHCLLERLHAALGNPTGAGESATFLDTHRDAEATCHTSGDSGDREPWRPHEGGSADTGRAEPKRADGESGKPPDAERVLCRSQQGPLIARLKSHLCARQKG